MQIPVTVYNIENVTVINLCMHNTHKLFTYLYNLQRKFLRIIINYCISFYCDFASTVSCAAFLDNGLSNTKCFFQLESILRKKNTYYTLKNVNISIYNKTAKIFSLYI